MPPNATASHVEVPEILKRPYHAPSLTYLGTMQDFVLSGVGDGPDADLFLDGAAS